MQAEEGIESDMYMDQQLVKHKKNKKEDPKKKEKTMMTQSDSEVQTENKNKDQKTVAQKVDSLKEDASNPDNYSKKKENEAASA